MPERICCKAVGALAPFDERALVELAEGRGVTSPAVVAGAQRELAGRAASPPERARWAARFAREFPGSWAQAEVQAGGAR